MIQTTFANGINPFLRETPPPKPPTRIVEPLTKRHALYEWVRDNPLRTRAEIATATGRTVDSVKQITQRMSAYGLIVFEQCQQSSIRLNRVRIK